MKVIYASCFALVLIAGCKAKKEKAPQQNNASQVVLVDVLIADTSHISNVVEVNGSVIANETIQLQTEISGRLTLLNIQEGTTVTKGTILAKINDADLRATLNKTKVQLELAEKNEARLRKLLDINGINQADYDAVLNQVNTFKADLAITQAQLDKTVLIAPFTGQLGLRMISPGAYVTPSTVLATLQETDKLKIDFTVPELYAGLIKKGRVVKIKTTNSGENFLHATVIAIEPQINAATRNLKVRAQLKSGNIYPGAFVKVLLDADNMTTGIMIPTNAIIPDAKAKKVIVVKNGKGRMVDIETGLRVTGAAEVIKGLSIGDSVVVTGVLFVRPSSDIKVRSVKKLSELIEY